MEVATKSVTLIFLQVWTQVVVAMALTNRNPAAASVPRDGKALIAPSLPAPTSVTTMAGALMGNASAMRGTVARTAAC